MSPRERSPFTSTGPTGHRSRMRERVLARGAATLADYEVLEMLLFLGIPRRDTKPLAKALINRFGSLAAVLEEPTSALRAFDLNDDTIAALHLPALAAHKLGEEEARTHPHLGNWEDLLTYFDTALAGAVPGQLRLLFLDNRNRLLADEAVLPGPGEGRRSPALDVAAILRRALALHATALICIRPCADKDDPRNVVLADAPLAQELAKAGALFSITLHDMFALRGGNWASLKQMGRL